MIPQLWTVGQPLTLPQLTISLSWPLQTGPLCSIPQWGPSEVVCAVPPPNPPTVVGYLQRSRTGDRHSSMGATCTNPELQRCIRLEPAGRRRHWSPPSLEVDLEHFLGGDVPLLRAEGGEASQQDYLPDPPSRKVPNG